MEWFVQNYLAEYTQRGAVRVLDVGSYDMNGSYKRFFDERFLYTGLDMVAGPNVDVVPKHIYKWPEIESNSFDVVVSGQTLEHTEFFWVTVAEMARVLRNDGLMCIIVPRSQGFHRHPVDCYRFDTDGMIALARYCNMLPLHASMNLAPEGAPLDWFIEGFGDAMLVARKPENWAGLIEMDQYVFQEADIKSLATGFVPQERLIHTRVIDSIIYQLNRLNNGLNRLKEKLCFQ